jgi:hypothetical protein
LEAAGAPSIEFEVLDDARVSDADITGWGYAPSTEFEGFDVPNFGDFPGSP